MSGFWDRTVVCEDDIATRGLLLSAGALGMVLDLVFCYGHSSRIGN